MKIHEYQAKKLFQNCNIPVADGQVAFTAQEALSIARTLGRYPVMLKAQIHAGGRGKGGGVKPAHSDEQVLTIAEQLLGMTLVTPQTGPMGRRVGKILVEAGQVIDKEYYLSILVDRKTAKIVVMASQAGGMDIEEVAKTAPEKIIRIYVDPLLGIQGFQLREIGFRLDLPPSSMKRFYALLANLFKFFMDHDASLVEINPMVLTAEGEILALDAKVEFDANALFRHKDLLELMDPDEEDPLEVEASRFNLNYINLDGDVGNIVNGAGLAMATMDMIQHAGASPANFLDVGGGATAEQVENAFRIILADAKVKAILINIFGGILRCDIFARGVVEAATKSGINIPVVIRMEGTNVDIGKQILAESGLNLITASDLNDAAKKIAACVR